MTTPRVQRRRLLTAGALLPAAILATAVAMNEWAVGRSLRLVVSMRSSADSTAQLFFDVGNGFNETDSATVPVHDLPTFCDYRFGLPAQPVKALRFDPLTCRGRLAISSIRVENRRGQAVRSIPLSAMQPMFQIAEYQERRGRIAIEIARQADDPQLMLELEAPIAPDLRALWLTVIRSWANTFLVAGAILLAILGSRPASGTAPSGSSRRLPTSTERASVP